MSDDEVRATPYAQLWLSELGAVVPEHKRGEPAQPPRPARDVAASDATRGGPRA